ncbi:MULTISPECIES: glutaredoxin family protein [unclassified Nesterenkonia]|uniref:glutaredoxin family protein n=1 Tax=unclassified Nesterenkonia TaxID=2629769 RepID=UPI001F4CB7D7|nr:glutaredoxin family protein [Nesterenkonia sp. DZ6]MCH8564002.1 glutaredoxin family protein [Nesterenkonia sp. YGD6]
MSRSVEVEVLTKQGCHLCKDAVAVAREACAEFSVELIERDITTEKELLASFAEEIPVLRINGQVKDFWRIDPQRLRRLLREATAES